MPFNFYLPKCEHRPALWAWCSHYVYIVLTLRPSISTKWHYNNWETPHIYKANYQTGQEGLLSERLTIGAYAECGI